MNLVISIVLAASSILATFMLQLCDDRSTGNTSLIALGSFFAILLAVVLVDYKKKFSLSKGACNFLVLLVVALQMGTLLKSRQGFMAFAEALHLGDCSGRRMRLPTLAYLYYFAPHICGAYVSLFIPSILVVRKGILLLQHCLGSKLH